MKRLILLLLLLPLSALGQTTARPGDSVYWDYLIADLPKIDRFEVQFGTSAFVSVGIPITKDGPNTLPNAHTYWMLIPSTVPFGSATVSVRACLQVSCSANLGPLAFTFAPAFPPTPANLRVGP